MSHDFTSRTARGPARHHKRRYSISHHAIERFRERVDEEFRHRDDADLGNVLDERVYHAESVYQVRDPRAPDQVTALRSVTCRHATYWAVVRNSTVVTVLDEEMARNNFGAQWTPVIETSAPSAPALNSAFAGLRNLKLPRLAPKAPSTAETIPAAENPTAEPPDLLAEAGVAYARARRRRHECAATVAALTAELDHASAALREAEADVDETHRQLIELAGAGETP